MAVKIRLFRVGKKHYPVYKIVATDSRVSRNGEFVENLGTYNPMVNPVSFDIKRERLDYWVGVGALFSEGFTKLLKYQKISYDSKKTSEAKK